MRNKYPVWAAWSEEAIWIYRQRKGGYVERTPLSRWMTADLRYFLRLYRLCNGTLLLRSGDSRGTFLDVARGEECFQPAEGWPETLASLPPYRVIPLKDGTVAGVHADKSMLVLWQIGAPYRTRKLPKGFLVRDLDQDDQGRLWICGTIHTEKLKSSECRPAIAMSEDDGLTWQVSEIARGGLTAAWWSLLSGVEAYRTIDLVSDYLVLSAETRDIDNISTFLYVQDPWGRWRSGMLKHDIFRATFAIQGGGVQIISHRGQSILVTRRKRWRHMSLLPTIRSLMSRIDKPPPKDARYEILDAKAAPNGEQILVVSVRLAREGRLARFGEAVAALAEDGDKLIAFQREEQPEVITAC